MPISIRPRTSLRRSVLIAAGCVGLTVCSSESTGPEDDPGVDFDDGLETVACTGLSLSASSGVPLDVIDAGTVPSTLEPPLAARVLAADGTLGYAWFQIDEGGGVVLVTPLHPSGSLAGGEVRIRATDGRVACEPWVFTVQPLPEAPGELAGVVDGLQEIQRAQAGLLGTTPDDLQATSVEVVPQILLPIASTQWVLDHPNNDNSLRAVADGSSSEDIPLEALDALLARTGLREALSGAASPVTGQASVGPFSAVEPEECTLEQIGDDTQRLSDCMGLADAVGEAVRDQLSPIGPELGAALLAAVAVPQLASGVRATLSGLAWTSIQLQLASWATLPSQLEQPTIEAVPDYFHEDDPGTGTWSASITALSLGWSRRVEDFEILLRAAGQRSLEQAAGVEVDFNAEVDRLLGDALASFLDSEEIPSQVFGPVSVDDEVWSYVAYRVLAPYAVDAVVTEVTHTSYRPVAVGRGELYVDVPGPDADAEGNLFGGWRRWEEAVIEVDSLIVRIEPSDTVINPESSDPVTFRVTVENSRYPDSVGGFIEQGSRMRFSGSDGSYILEYAPPSSGSAADPDSIHVEHLLRVGARENGPDRFDFAIVRFGEVVITPELPCIDPLVEVALSAEVVGAADQSVTWAAVHGMIDGNGRYTAPSEIPTAGVDTIRATSVEVPGLVGELVVPIGCTCRFGVQMSGFHNIVINATAALTAESLDPSTHGEADVVLDEDGNLTSIQFLGPLFGTGFEGSFLRDNWGPIPGGTTGSFEITGTAQVYDRQPTGGSELFSIITGPAFWEPDWQPLDLVIDNWDDGQVTGSLSGVVLDADAPDFARPTQMRIDFLARTKVGGTTPSSCTPPPSG